MKKLTGLLAGVCVSAIGLGVAMAQEAMGPPKVLVIMREYLKPGRGGSVPTSRWKQCPGRRGYCS